jgi:RNA polymerase sigma-70 factor, ECF subfamily
LSTGSGPGKDFIDAYEEHVWDVYAFLAYRLGSRNEAEDLTQVTFERAIRAWARFDPARASVKTWLLTIARNAMIDQLRRKPAAGDVSLEEETESLHPTYSGPEEVALGLSPELETALGQLAAREREALALRFGADLRGSEIAELLGLTVDNVHQILSRALRKLRVDLETEQGPATSSRVDPRR